MDESLIQQLEAQRPSFKREWETLLRTEPTLSPLGNPDTLVFMMDETLSDLIKGLRRREQKHQAVNPRSLLVPLQRHCECGMNPLLTYYATGELAVHLVAGNVLKQEVELDETLACYHTLAMRELHMLCAVCQHRQSGSGPSHPPLRR
ncbi:MAG: hypothetical protein Q8J74_09375 [Candidatus Didemnitutus sp.]|nr:hypothetical protein [Candidatus Didemnitutus sp.]